MKNILNYSEEVNYFSLFILDINFHLCSFSTDFWAIDLA